MSPGDLLLRWVSCFHELRLARVQAAAERLCVPPVHMDRDDPRRTQYVRSARRIARNLIRLAHVEESSPDRLLTVPPTILSLSTGRHILLGARSDSLLGDLSGAPGVTGMPPLAQPEGPVVHYLSGAEEAVVAAAERLKVTFARDRGGELLASLPRLSEILANAPQEGIPERTERWDPDAAIARSRWSRTRTGDHVPGVYRTLRKPHQWYQSPPKSGPSVRLDTPERRVAAAWAFLREWKLGYSPERRELSVPAVGFGLPLLVDRALILASGRLPEFGSRGWKYFEIDPDRAHHVARIVGTLLEEVK